MACSWGAFLGCCCFLVMLFTRCDCVRMLPAEVKREIQNHKDDVSKIIDYVLRGAGKHQAITLLADMTDKFGPRGTGTQALEDSIDYAYDKLKKEGFSNVVTEDVTAEKWTRNKESLMMLEPLEREMSLLSLGSSVGTVGDMEGEVIVVKSFDELDKMAQSNADVFKDKIVLYNQIWDGYSYTNQYRMMGASRAARHGAKAALLRSVTNFGIYTPHTGIQNYNLTVSKTKIPVAAVTIEDAQQMQRYSDRGVTIRVRLNMACVNEGPITTRNVIAELPGASIPEEVVIIGGHIDSWDVGFGVMDDGGGVVISWQAISVLQALNLIPKRTIRTVFWTAEEIGLVGAQKYFDMHKDEHESISLIMESDYGTFKPIGLGFTGTESARAIIREILSLLKPINATGVSTEGASPDTVVWIKNKNVPGADLWNANDKYFYYHHTHGDTITMEDPDDLDLCVIVWTVSAYIVANLADKLPRTEIYEMMMDNNTSGAQSGGILCALNIIISLLIMLWLQKAY